MPLPNHFDRYQLSKRTASEVKNNAGKVKADKNKPGDAEQNAKRQALADAHERYPEHYAVVMLDAVMSRPEIAALLDRHQQELDAAVAAAMPEVFEDMTAAVPRQLNAKEEQNNAQRNNS